MSEALDSKAPMHIVNSSMWSKLYQLDYILEEYDVNERIMVLTISEDCRKRFQGNAIQPPQYISIKIIEEWELSDSETLHFSRHPISASTIIPKWEPGKKNENILSLPQGTVIKICLLYQIEMSIPVCPSPNKCEWIRVGEIEIVT